MRLYRETVARPGVGRRDVIVQPLEVTEAPLHNYSLVEPLWLLPLLIESIIS